jgi:4-hydroxybenzoate polyprenyltransferase
MEQFTTSTSQTTTIRVPGPLARLLSLFILILFIVLAFIIAVPLILIALVVGLVFYFYIKIKQLFTRAHDPNGPLDGRHNVKVINRDE